MLTMDGGRRPPAIITIFHLALPLKVSYKALKRLYNNPKCLNYPLLPYGSFSFAQWPRMGRQLSLKPNMGISPIGAIASWALWPLKGPEGLKGKAFKALLAPCPARPPISPLLLAPD